ncbi:hypothetical protein [Streptomyces pristinaespiralis]|uniref:hypothetical protein n=1 Tax=Streptomyces pristinaespiralis TaxID=38300 RepID=UPI0033FEDE4A
MPVSVRLLATLPTLLSPASADAPHVLCGPGHRLLVQRGDTEVAVRDLDQNGPEVRFPAPWPRGFGSVTVSPAGDVAVFAGVHALRAVDRAGAVLWEVRHGCWSSTVCAEPHTSFVEYADDRNHRYADHGSAAFSPDGKLLWAHVRSDSGGDLEEWLVLDPADGTVLGRAGTGTVGSSFLTPHPDPAYMGLTVGEGDEDSPALWGRWDGRTLSVRRLDEQVLLAVSPSGRHLLATDPGQWCLYLLQKEDGEELRRLAAADAVPPPPGDDHARWDYEAAFPHDDAAVVGTGYDMGDPRHWLVDPATMRLHGRIAYPFPVHGSARGAGHGTWYTVSQDQTLLYLWRLDGR